ncbi:unnamed protein product, partial [Scytosiphon promiscuus]
MGREWSRVATAATALGVLLRSDGFHFSSHVNHRTAGSSHGSRSEKEITKPPFMAAGDDNLPDADEGGTAFGEKSRFMPISFDRIDVPVAPPEKKEGASVPAQKTISNTPGVATAASAAKEKHLGAAKMKSREGEKDFIKPEEVIGFSKEREAKKEVPPMFEPRAAQAVLNGGTTPCNIKVVGVGGGGGNAVNRMVETGIGGVEFWSINTDAQALTRNLAPGKLAIGQSVTRGLGAGGVPSVGRKAAEESIDDIKLVMEGADMV